jgi:HEAT repeat protein
MINFGRKTIMPTPNGHSQTTDFTDTALLQELWWLLPQVTFQAARGSYVKGQRVSVLVDTEPGETPGTFHAGLSVFALRPDAAEMAGIEIALTGRMEGQPQIRCMRRGVTNRRGSLTLHDLPSGSYRLLLARSLVAPTQPIAALPQAAGFATRPSALISHKYQADDASLLCTLHETRERELLLDVRVTPPDTPRDHASSAALAALLRDSDPNVRFDAVQAVRALGSAAATPEILTGLVALLRDSASDVRRAAVGAMEALGNAAATPEVLTALSALLGDLDPDVRFSAVKAVGALGNAAATPEILTGLGVLLRDAAFNVRWAAVGAMEALGNAAATPEILTGLAALLGDAAFEVRQAAVQAVRALGNAAATPEIFTGLAALLREADPAVRLATAGVVRTLGSAAATPEILTGAERESDQDQTTPGDLWVEYVIIEPATGRVATVERAGQRVELAGQAPLRPGAAGQHTARISLGYHVTLSVGYTLRAYLIPAVAVEAA